MASLERTGQYFWQCNLTAVRVSCPGSQRRQIDTAQLMLGSAQSPQM